MIEALEKLLSLMKHSTYINKYEIESNKEINQCEGSLDNLFPVFLSE